MRERQRNFICLFSTNATIHVMQLQPDKNSVAGKILSELFLCKLSQGLTIGEIAEIK